MRKTLIILCSIVLFITSCTLKLNHIKTPANSPSLRGLNATPNVVWVSGQNGSFQKLANNTLITSFDTIGLKGTHELDFRDVHGFNEIEAILMSSGNGCKIYRTSDGGTTWELVYENTDKDIFFDGMDFWDNKRGIAFGDPIDGQLFLIKTTDGGKTWKQLIPDSVPKVLPKEAGFAASGTGIVCKDDNTVWIATGGGTKARVFKSKDGGVNWKVYDTPIKTNPEKYRGIYSMAMKDKLNGIVVGGSFTDSAGTDGICAITSNGGESWTLSTQMPSGYRSCVAYLEKNTYICCGRNGIDVTYDGGLNWVTISSTGFYSTARVGELVWFAGKKGKIAHLPMKHIRRLAPHSR